MLYWLFLLHLIAIIAKVGLPNCPHCFQNQPVPCTAFTCLFSKNFFSRACSSYYHGSSPTAFLCRSHLSQSRKLCYLVIFFLRFHSFHLPRPVSVSTFPSFFSMTHTSITPPLHFVTNFYLSVFSVGICKKLVTTSFFEFRFSMGCDISYCLLCLGLIGFFPSFSLLISTFHASPSNSHFPDPLVRIYFSRRVSCFFRFMGHVQSRHVQSLYIRNKPSLLQSITVLPDMSGLLICDGSYLSLF